MNPMEKRPDHPALKQMTESMLLAGSGHSRESILGGAFPLPGTQGLTFDKMPPHTAVIGSTGSGKTIIQKHLMSAVLPSNGGLRFRSVVYDPKRELFPYLCKIGIPQSQIIVTHPFDGRSACWNLAADFREPAQIEELSLIIIPEPEKAHENRFFDDTARIIVQDVIESLIKIRNGSWELRDVCEACSSLETLKAVLTKTENGTRSWDVYLKPAESLYGDRTAQSIQATISTHMRPLYSLAALWYCAERKFSLDQWHQGSGILLLGADPRREKTLQRINQLLIQRICQLVLGRKEENPVDLTWFFLDEIREAGKLNGFRKLLTEGRSKGARVVLGFQDIEGLYSLYDTHEAEEMVGLCANRIVLHLDNPKTRKWASDFFGEAEVFTSSETVGEQTGREVTSSTGLQTSLTLRVNALPIEFHNLPLGNPFDGVDGWFSIPGRRNRFHLESSAAKHALRIGPGHENAKLPTEFDERPTDQQKLPPWTKPELDNMGLQIEKQTPPKPGAKSKVKIETGNLFNDEIGQGD